MDVMHLHNHINLIHVLVGIIVTMFIGAFWYSPTVFGKKWAKEYGFDMRSMKANASHYLGGAVVAIITVLGIAILLTLLKISTIAEAIEWGILSWVTFVATSHFSGVIWARKPAKVYVIDVFYLLVIILFNTILLTAWK
jgi:hypothetical protein